MRNDKESEPRDIYLGEYKHIQQTPCPRDFAYWYEGKFAADAPYRVCDAKGSESLGLVTPASEEREG